MKAKTKKSAKKAASDFTANLGRERKEKFCRIAEENNRSMNGQLCQWIDEAEDPAKEKEEVIRKKE